MRKMWNACRSTKTFKRIAQKSHWEIFLWGVIGTIFIVLTTRDVCLLIVAFASEETASLVSLDRKTNMEFTPSPTIYVVNDISKIIETYRSANITNLVDSVERFIQLDDLKNASTAELEAALLFAIAKQQSEVFETPRRKVHETSRDARAIFENLTIAHLESRLSFDYFDLHRSLAVVYCEKSGIVLHFHSQLTPSRARELSVCTKQQVLYVNEDGFSFRLLDWIVFDDAYESLLVVAEPLSLYVENDGDVDLSALGINFKGVSHIDEETIADSILYLKAGQPNTLTYVAVGAVLRRLDRRTAPCSANELNYDCKNRCVASAYMELCGYWPLLYLAYAPPNSTRSSNTESTASSLKLCNQEYMSSFEEECAKRCKPDCVSRFYGFQSEINEHAGDEVDRNSVDRKWMRSNIFPRMTEFTVIEERLTMSWETFLAQVGGALGLYLGLSFATLLRGPIFLANVLCERGGNTTKDVDEKRDEKMEMHHPFIGRLKLLESNARESHLVLVDRISGHEHTLTLMQNQLSEIQKQLSSMK